MADQTPNQDLTNLSQGVVEKAEQIEATDEKSAVQSGVKDQVPAEPEARVAPPNAKWYVVHTYSGHENRVAASIKQRVEAMKVSDRVYDILVPPRDTIIVRRGKKEAQKEKIFPGYVMVKMILDDDSWLVVRTTPGVTAFVGVGNRPTPLTDKEVEAITKFSQAGGGPKFKAAFSVGEAVKISDPDHPFANLLGTVDQIDDARGKVKILVSIFGRETPVEVDFMQISKL